MLAEARQYLPAAGEHANRAWVLGREAEEAIALSDPAARQLIRQAAEAFASAHDMAPAGPRPQGPPTASGGQLRDTQCHRQAPAGALITNPSHNEHDLAGWGEAPLGWGGEPRC